MIWEFMLWVSPNRSPATFGLYYRAPGVRKLPLKDFWAPLGAKIVRAQTQACICLCVRVCVCVCVRVCVCDLMHSSAHTLHVGIEHSWTLAFFLRELRPSNVPTSSPLFFPSDFFSVLWILKMTICGQQATTDPVELGR